MKHTKKIFLVLLCVILCMSAVSVLCTAVTYVDGMSTTYNGGSGANLTGNGYNVYLTSDAAIGYRVTLLRKTASGSFTRLGSTDLMLKGNIQYPTETYRNHLKITAAGKTYYNVDKYTYKQIYSSITKIEAQRLGSIGQKYTSAYSYYNGTTASLGCNVPLTAGDAKPWAFSEEKMNNVLEKFGSYTMAGLKATDYIEMEPLYSLRINGTGYTVTVTDIALLGRVLFSDSSTGNEGDGNGYDWLTICNYTNKNYPKELYTNDSDSHSDLGIADGSALTSRTSFKNVFEKGYGLLIAWNKTPHKLTIHYDCKGSSPTISSTTYSIKSTDSNRIYKGSSYFKQTVMYDNYISTTSGLMNLSTFGITAPTGKHFTGWEYDGKLFDPDDLTLRASDISKDIASGDDTVWLTAEFENNTYTVEYYVNGTKQTGLTQKCTYGTSYTFKALPSAGTGNHFTDSDWHLSSATGTAKTPGGSFKNLTAKDGGTVKLYATTEKNTYTVKYYLDGTEQTGFSQSCTYGTSYSYRDIPTKTGYSVSGWWSGSSASSKGTQYSEGNSFSNLTSTNGGTVKRYAYSTANKYTVKYYLDGVEQTALAQSCNYGTSYTFKALPSASTGKHLTDSVWHLSSATGTAKTPGASYKNLSTTDGATVKLYATTEYNTYTVKYFLDGTEKTDMEQSCSYGTSYKYSSLPSRTGFTVDGWWSGASSDSKGTQYTAGGTFRNLTSVNGGVISRYSYSAVNRFSIEYKLDGGSHGTNHPDTAKYGVDVVISNPAKKGCTFLGWTIEGCDTVTHYHDAQDNADANNHKNVSDYLNSFKTTSLTEKTSSTHFRNLRSTSGTVIFTAHWSKNSYSVEYYLDGVKQTGLTQSCTYGTSYSYASKPSVTVKTGYTTSVSAWWSGSSSTGKGTQYSPGAVFSDLTASDGATVKRYAYSGKTPITYIIHYNSNGGTGSMNDQTMTYDVGSRLSSNSFEKQNSTFIKWNTKADGTGTDYDDGQSVKNLTATQGKVINLYAQWEENSTALSLVPIVPNADYREKTEVISSFYIINSSENDCKPDDNITVVFKVFKNSSVIKTVTVNNVVVPADEKNLLYFKWTVPELTGETIKITAEIVDGDIHYGQFSKTYSTCEYEISQTPDTQYEATAPEDFVMKSVPTETDSTLNWYVWDYSDGAFVKKTYSANLNGNTVTIKPAASANSWKDNGKTYTKSGYGIEINVTDTVSTSLSGSCTDIQYVSATFPEFGYATVNTKYRTLEKVAEKWVFRTNEDYGRIHFTPLWFPDGSYIASVNISDCWTPAGMLRRTVNSNELIIEGTAYDDWWVD